ncbi:nucleotide disphospho-sugar-binding domain-containing protein [Accumulibacter sp.]|uniref:nucleotide disphospho-sugar-binding domain-containing protein n=1 Tax=Accumulibacter sp. TaxID=2053492 RepID=UPI0035B249C2
MRPRRFLFVVGEHVGHLHAVLGVARRLQQRGHEVMFASSHSPQPVRQAGFECEALPWLDGPDDAIARAPDRVRRRFEQRAWVDAAVGAARRLVDSHRPELLLFQPFLLETYPLFHGLVPAVAFSTKPLLSADPWVPPYTCATIPRDDALSRLQVRLDWARTRARYAAYQASCALAQWHSGVSHRSLLLETARRTGFPLRTENVTRSLPIDIAFRSVPELVLHAREFDLPRARPLPSRISYLGPCLDLPRSRPDPGPDVPGNGPLVYCHLGTVGRQNGQHKRELYRTLLGVAQATATWRWLFATGDADMAAWIRRETGSCKPSVEIRDWVSQFAVLAQTDVFVTHAGANSVKEALHHGVPMLALPLAADQPGMAARIVYHGVGMMLDGRRCFAGDVHACLKRLLSERSFRERANAFAELSGRYDQALVAERTLEQHASSAWARRSSDGIVTPPVSNTLLRG